MIHNAIVMSGGSGDISLTSLTILTPPNKTTYTYNSFSTEQFDPTGMTFEATLSVFGTSITAPIDVDRVTLTPTTITSETTQIVASLKFGGQTISAIQPITMAHRSPTWQDLESVSMTWEMLESRFNSWAELESA